MALSNGFLEALREYAINAPDGDAKSSAEAMRDALNDATGRSLAEAEDTAFGMLTDLLTGQSWSGDTGGQEPPVQADQPPADPVPEPPGGNS